MRAPGLHAGLLLGRSSPWNMIHGQGTSEVRSPDFGVSSVQSGQVTSVSSTANAKNNRSYPHRAVGLNAPQCGAPNMVAIIIIIIKAVVTPRTEPQL